MILSKIWEQYFLKELVKTTLFFLLTFYGLYILIDYANHAATLHKHQVSFHVTETIIYYLCDFIKRLNILLPFALLLAAIRTLSNLNSNNELVALVSSGVSIHKLLKPFLIVGFSFSILVFISTETLLPLAMSKFKNIEDSRSNKRKRFEPATAQHINLEDGSLLLFQNYDSDKKRFFDAYWIQNGQDIYRIKYLYPNMDSKDSPVGYFIDHLTRTSQGHLVNQEAVQKKTFTDLKFNAKALFETITLPEEQSFSELWEKVSYSRTLSSEKESQIVTAFYHKLIMPWFCLLAIIGPAPFCLRITRNLPIFFIYAGAIFTFIALDLFLNAAVLLAKRQTLPPFLTLWTPFLLAFSFFFYRYIRIRY